MYTIDLTGKVAIITGARRGLGRQIALTLAQAGAHVIANSRNFREGGDKLLSELQAAGEGTALLAEGSVENREDVKRIVNLGIEKFGKIDILVNNAGILHKEPFIEIDDESWKTVLDVNLNGTFIFSQEIAKIMIRQNSGKIVNIASIAGMRGSAKYASYAASKGAIINLTKTLARELGEHGINVNAVNPGRIKTDMLMKSLGSERERYISETPLGRLGTPEEVADVVLFLVSDLSRYITGETIEISGGAY